MLCVQGVGMSSVHLITSDLEFVVQVDDICIGHFPLPVIQNR